MSDANAYKPIMFFVIKISFLAGVYYYFSDQINIYASTPDLVMAVIYTAAYAGVILLLLLMFRWSGFISRVLAGFGGVAALSIVIGLYLVNNGFSNIAFIGSYIGILTLTILLGYTLLFKKV